MQILLLCIDLFNVRKRKFASRSSLLLTEQQGVMEAFVPSLSVDFCYCFASVNNAEHLMKTLVGLPVGLSWNSAIRSHSECLLAWCLSGKSFICISRGSNVKGKRPRLRASYSQITINRHKQRAVCFCRQRKLPWRRQPPTYFQLRRISGVSLR